MGFAGRVGGSETTSTRQPRKTFNFSWLLLGPVDNILKDLADVGFEKQHGKVEM